jgi:hypothetical protein
LPVLRPWRIPLFWANEGQQVSSKARASQKELSDFMRLASCVATQANTVWAALEFS